MRYKIRNTLIPIPHGPVEQSFEEIILCTLDMHDKGKNLSNSPLIASQLNKWHKDCCYPDNGGKWIPHEGEELTKRLLLRQEAFISMYEDFKTNSYDETKDPMLVWFDEDGFIHLYDGYHRLLIMKHLGQEAKVVCETEWSGIDGAVGKDFPLTEVLVKEPPEGKWLYQPVDDERLKGWELGRVNTPARLDHIAQNLVGKTVLDIGCSEGYFSRELAKRGYKVTAIDNNKGLLSSARYLSTIGNISVDYHLVDDWKSFVDQNGHFDNILLLSVIHNDMKTIGVEEGLKKLEALRGKASRVFLEGPYYEWGESTGKHGFTGKPPFDFSARGSVVRLEDTIGYKVMEKWSPKPKSRPIYTFAVESVLECKVDEEGLICEPDVNGYPMYLFKDEKWITPIITKNHTYEPKTTGCIKEWLKPGQTFVDAGAHTGYFTILASKAVGEGGRVYAFEPSAENMKVLKANLTLNGCSNVIAINKALTDKSGKTCLYRMDPTSHGQLYLRGALIGDKELGWQGYKPKDVLARNDYEEVETVRLDEVLSEPPDMIKVDVEGSEMLALKGMGKLLTKSSSMTIFIEDLTGEGVKHLADKFGFAVIDRPLEHWNHMLHKGGTTQPWWSLELWLVPQRSHYKPLFDTLMSGPYRNIMEIGTHAGNNAVVMIKAAAKKVPEEEIHYYGFDLFEEMTPELTGQEFSFSRMPPPMQDARAHIEKNTKAKVTLIKGNTRKTLKDTVKTLPKMDLIYIDGGHTVETTKNDWKYASRLMHKNTVVYFDDYCVEMPFVGAKVIVDELAPKYAAQVMPEVNHYPRVFGRLRSQLLRVQLKDVTIKKGVGAMPHFRFHLLGLPHSKTTKEWVLCPFTQLTYKMAQMMTEMGHEVIHYGTEGSNPPCAEQVNVLTEAVQKQAYGNWTPESQLWIHKGNDLAYTTFRRNAIAEIKLRIQPHDILLVSIGGWQKEVANAFSAMPAVEFCVGYQGIFSKFKVFPSYAWMHYLYGVQAKSVKWNLSDGNWYDAVIPHFFDPNDFEFSDKKGDYYLYIGRIIARKGPHIAVDVCKRIGAKIIMAGQPVQPSESAKGRSLKSFGMDQPHVEYVGTVDRKQRNKLMGGAKAVIIPSTYMEPFGKVVVESLLCGTPVITTDWGSFPEIVKHGEVGYRCRTMDDFIWAANNVHKLDPKACREYAIANFSMERIGKAYHEYFTKIHDLFGKGWYAEHPDRTDLDWLKRY